MHQSIHCVVYTETICWKRPKHPSAMVGCTACSTSARGDTCSCKENENNLCVLKRRGFQDLLVAKKATHIVCTFCAKQGEKYDLYTYLLMFAERNMRINQKLIKMIIIIRGEEWGQGQSWECEFVSLLSISYHIVLIFFFDRVFLHCPGWRAVA